MSDEQSTAQIVFKNGKVMFLDKSDYDWLCRYNWLLSSSGYAYSRCTTPSGRVACLYFHRLIMGAIKDEIVDHINGNTLDNRRSNLRICTSQQNQMNMRLRKDNKTGRKGVRLDRNAKRRGAYRATITVDKKVIYLGRFNTLNEAATAYDEASKRYHGEYSYINRNSQ